MRLMFRLAAIALVSLAAVEAAQAQSAECQRLQQAIASAGRGSGPNAQYEAAAQKQRGEIDRTVAYARSIGCENRKFLFFGSGPPPQCEQINGQIARMQANLADLQARAGGSDGGRAELVARYNSECAAPQRPGGIFDALFGNPRDQQQAPADVQTVPLSPDGNPDGQPGEPGEKEAHAGSKAVCVRSCDGSYFPVSYSAFGRLDELQDMCRALCPNADVTLYTYSPSNDIDQAVSISGARYMDLPTALKYRKSVDNSCSCRRRGQSWAEALAGAEQRLGGLGKTDIHRDAGAIGRTVATQTRSQSQGRQDAARGPQDRRSRSESRRAGPNADRPIARSAGGDGEPGIVRDRRRRRGKRPALHQGPGRRRKRSSGPTASSGGCG